MRSLFQKLFLTLLLIWVLPLPASADTLFISPATGNYSNGQTFSVRVFVSSPQQAINAVSGVLSFPTDKLQVVSVSKVGSILTLWVQEPTFSNTQGTVNFEGVVPNPGFKGADGRIIVVNFKAISSGSANLRISNGSLLANDGSGTNILSTLGQAAFTIGAVVPPVEQTQNPGVPTQGTSLSTNILQVNSTTHPDSNKWYKERDASFTWNLPNGTNETWLSLSKQPNTTPTVKYSPAIDRKILPNTAEGIWYLHVQTKGTSGSSAVAHYRFNIDTTSPDSFSIKKIEDPDSTNPTPKFAFIATDAISGIDHYSVSIDGSKEQIWRDDGSGIYTPPPLKPGSHSIVAKAYDEAGNSAAATVDFVIEGITAPKITSYTEQVSDSKPIIVQGVAPANVSVNVYLSKGKNEPLIKNVTPDESGSFTAVYETEELERGAYSLQAVSVDRRGAESEPSPEKTVVVRSAWFQSIGSSVLNAFAVAIPVLALLFVLIIGILYGYNRIRIVRRKLRRELHTIDNLVGKSFDLLKEDIEDSIHLLERAKTKRRLTEEEDAIIDRLRQNLRDAEKIIHKEVLTAEKEIGD